MPTIHVCALSKIADEVRATGARTLVTLINAQTPVERPRDIVPAKHLSISMSDITAPSSLPPICIAIVFLSSRSL